MTRRTLLQTLALIVPFRWTKRIPVESNMIGYLDTAPAMLVPAVLTSTQQQEIRITITASDACGFREQLSPIIDIMIQKLLQNKRRKLGV